MCTHQYQKESKDEFGLFKCKLSEAFKDRELPMDKQGKCIFHSEDLDWKRSNNFTQWLDELIAYFSLEDKGNNHFLREVVFVGSESKVIDYLPKIYTFNLDYCWFADHTKTSGYTFENHLYFYNLKMTKEMYFNHCHFKKEVEFCRGYNISEELTPTIEFSNCHFHHLFQMNYIDAMSLNLVVQECIFHESVNFQEIHLKDCFINFCSTFEQPFTIENSSFSARATSFSGCVFEEEVNFINTFFEKEVNFNRIEVQNIWNIWGTPYNDVFKGVVGMDLKTEQIYGTINFSHVNLLALNQEDKDQILSLEPLGKVKIGAGCIKYRHRTQPKKITIKDGNQPLVLDMTHAFSTYFAEHQGINLGMEVLERSTEHITIFYFTDEDLKNPIEDYLVGVQYNFLRGILHEHHLISENNYGAMRLNIRAMISLLSIFLNARIQIQMGEWTPDDGLAMFDSISFDNQPFLEKEKLHEFLQGISIEKSLQGTLSGFTMNLFMGEKTVYLEKPNNVNIKPPENI